MYFWCVFELALFLKLQHVSPHGNVLDRFTEFALVGYHTKLQAATVRDSLVNMVDHLAPNETDISIRRRCRPKTVLKEFEYRTETHFHIKLICNCYICKLACLWFCNNLLEFHNIFVWMIDCVMPCFHETIYLTITDHDQMFLISTKHSFCGCSSALLLPVEPVTLIREHETQRLFHHEDQQAEKKKKKKSCSCHFLKS